MHADPEAAIRPWKLTQNSASDPSELLMHGGPYHKYKGGGGN